jgi:hypothetical protein
MRIPSRRIFQPPHGDFALSIPFAPPERGRGGA